MELMTGQRVGHFEILEKVGEGGMGVVYKARDASLNRVVAIKALPASSAADPDRRQRFIQEAQAASALNHPNIVTIHEIFSEAGSDYIAMEFVPGKTLDEVIARKGMKLTDALRTAEQIAGALAAAHAAGITHRDLKPTNVMVGPDGHVKVLDFGLAKLSEPDPAGQDAPTLTAAPLTEKGAVLGTLAYMSPEQADGKPVDWRSDIFSFGALLYEMITGRRAFEAEGRVSTLSAVLEKEPPPISEIVPSAPRELQRLIARCMRKKQAERSQSLLDVRHALEEIRSELASGVTMAPGVSAPDGRPRRSVRWAYFAAGVAVVLALFPVISRWFRPPPMGFQSRPLTSYPGIEQNPALSPDGKQVAFSWNGPGEDNFDIYIRRLGSGDPLRLTTDVALDSDPVWTPDGEQIAFIRHGGPGSARVLVIPALGGVERQIATIPGGPESRIAFGADGKVLVATDDHALALVRVDTGEKRYLDLKVSFKGHAHPILPALSADGSRIAFVVRDAAAGDLLYSAGFSRTGEITEEPYQVAATRFGALNSVAWGSDGRLYFADSGSGSSRVLRAGPGGRPPMPLPGLSDHLAEVTAAGNRLVCTYSLRNSDLWSASIGHARDAAPVPFLPSTREEAHPRFSPDGLRIAFVSERGGDSDIWVAEASGNALRQVTQGIAVRSAPEWSPDGTELLFSAYTTSGRGAYIVRAEGGKLRQIGPPGVGRAQWSRDGKTIYFIWGSGERYRLYRTASSGDGGKTEINAAEWAGGDTILGETPDAAAILVESRESGVWRVPLSRVEPDVLVEDAGAATLVRDDLYFPDFDAGALRVYRFATGKVSTVAKLDGPRFFDYTISPDASRIVYSRPDRGSRDLLAVDLP